MNYNSKSLILSLSILLVFTACQGGGGNSGGPYFSGSEGIRMDLEPGSPPGEFYYFSPAFLQQQGGDENTFDIVVELQNEGSSWSKGGVYVTGFSPNYIWVEGQTPPPGGWPSCLWGNIGLVNGQWTFNFACQNLGAGYYHSGDDWWASTNLGGVLRLAGVGQSEGGDQPWYTDLKDAVVTVSDGITVSGGEVNGESRYAMNFGQFDTQYLNRGRLLLILSENPNFGIDFDRNGVGYEYVLQGDTPEFPGGEDDYAVMTAHVKDFPLGRDDLAQDFLITNCYLYTTYSSPQVCIDPVPYAEGRKVCSQEVVEQPNSQGAPVSITIRDVKNTPQSVAFTVEVQNIGNGDVFNFGSAEVCSPFASRRVTSADKNVVILGIVRVGNQELDCNSRVVRLDPSGRGQVTCRYWHNGQYTSTSGFETPVAIEAWYAYREVEQRTVILRRGD